MVTATKKRVNFDTTPEDMKLIHKIGKRMTIRYKEIHSMDLDLIDMEMDISAVHLNGCPLDLKKLFKADDFNFAHDVIGIMNNIDRTTGQLKNCFSPRCSQ